MKKTIILLFQLLIPLTIFSQKIDSISASTVTAGQGLNLTLYCSGTHFHPTVENKLDFNFNVVKGTQVVNSIGVIDSFSLSANMLIPDYIPSGYYDVSLTNANDGTMVLKKGLHVMGASTPSSFLSPTFANSGKTVNVSIIGIGTHFKKGEGLTVKFNGGDVSSKTIVSDTLINTTLIIPKDKNGSYTVSVYNTIDGFTNREFNVIGRPSPAIVDVSPDTASAGKTVTVKISGTNTHFTRAQNKVNFGFSSDSADVIVLNDSSLTATISIPVKTFTNDYDIIVTNAEDGSLKLINNFRVKGVPMPSIISLNPSKVTSGQTLDLMIYSKNTHFLSEKPDVRFNFFQTAGTTVLNSLTVIGDTILKANITLPNYLKTGNYMLHVSSSSIGSRWINFHVDGAPDATLVSITPSEANAGQILNVTVFGKNTNFYKGKPTTLLFDFGLQGIVTADSIIIHDDSILKARIAIPSDVVTGYYKLVVMDSIDGSPALYKSFNVTGTFHAEINSIKPGKGKAGETLDLIVFGKKTHFLQDEPDLFVDFKQPNGANSLNAITYINDTILIGNITIPATTLAGEYNIRLSSISDGIMNGTFKVEEECRVHYNTTYDKSNNTFTLELDSLTTLANSFFWNFGDGTTSTDKLPTHTFASDTLYNVCLTASTIGDSCTYCHIIGKDSLGNPVLKKKGFSANVVPYKPVITNINDLWQNNSVNIIYPNPATNQITIQNDAFDITSETEVIIYGVDGKTLFKQYLAKNRSEINVSCFAKGIYLLQLRNGKNSKQIKFIKE